MDMKIHEHNGRKIRFDEKKHKYILDNGKELYSVTEYIHTWFPEFDAPAMAKKCSKGRNPKYKGRKPEEILKEWEDKKNKAANDGTAVHEYCEAFITGSDTFPTPQNDRQRKLMEQANICIQELAEEYNFIDVEKVVFSPELNLSGTFDLLLEHKKTGELVIADWKTNEEIKRENWLSKGLSILKHMHDCNFNHYSLQLNLYEYILTKEGYYPYFGFGKLLLHVTEDCVYKYTIEDMQDVIKMMKG